MFSFSGVIVEEFSSTSATEASILPGRIVDLLNLNWFRSFILLEDGLGNPVVELNGEIIV